MQFRRIVRSDLKNAPHHLRSDRSGRPVLTDGGAPRLPGDIPTVCLQSTKYKSCMQRLCQQPEFLEVRSIERTTELAKHYTLRSI